MDREKCVVIHSHSFRKEMGEWTSRKRVKREEGRGEEGGVKGG